MQNKVVGNLGEKIIAERLVEQGFQIVGRQVRTKYGEVDLIATKPQRVLFVEVKTRTGQHFGFPEEAINQKKRTNMLRTALALVQRMNIKCDWELVVYAVELDLNKRRATCSRYQLD